MKEKYILISSISFPIVAIILLAIIIQYNDKPKEADSTYRQALKMYEAKSESPTSALLASNVFKDKNIDSISNKTNVSYLEIFNDKLSLPQEQVSHLINELEQEHAAIISQYKDEGRKISKILQLNPRYKIVIATYLEVDPGILSLEDLDRLKLESSELYFLKTFASSNDLLILLSKNQLTKEYLQINNLQRIYGNNHQLNNSQGRNLSNIPSAKK